jgi:hypothetical protein
MRGILKTTLFGAALAAAGAGFAQSSTSPQKGDEDPTPVSSPSATQPSSTDTNSMSGSSSSTGSTTGTTGAYTSPSGSTAATTAPGTYTGTVKTVDAGRTLVITTADGQTQTFDISSSPTLNTSIAAGRQVRVKQSVDASGKTVVTVEPYR